MGGASGDKLPPTHKNGKEGKKWEGEKGRKKGKRRKGKEEEEKRREKERKTKKRKWNFKPRFLGRLMHHFDYFHSEKSDNAPLTVGLYPINCVVIQANGKQRCNR